jgi:hypothetical protein
MNVFDKLIEENNYLDKYKRVEESKQQEWKEAFENVKTTLQKEVPKFISKEREKATKIAELSGTKMLG